MTSAISTTDINAAFPIPGRDNDSQAFRTNFGAIKTGLETAAGEISLLQAQKADLITQNFFSNATPATTTQTGAIVVAGGVGIGKDLFVGGQLIVGGSSGITTSTVVSSTNTEVIVTGTFGAPIYTIAPTIANNHLFTGKISIAQASGSTSTHLYVTTTATNQTAGHFIGSLSQTTSIKLRNSHGGNAAGENYSFIQYEIGTGEVITNVGSVKHYNGSIHYSGTTTFTSSTVFKENITLATGKNIRFSDSTVWIGDINQADFDTANIKIGVGKFTLGGTSPGDYYGVLAENPVAAFVATEQVIIGSYLAGDIVVATTSSLRPGSGAGVLSLGGSSHPWSAVFANSGTIQTSDIRLKENIKPLALGLDFIKKIEPVSYDLKSGSANHWGLISQQVQSVLNEFNAAFGGLVVTDDGKLHLIYTEFISPLIKSIHELADENDKLRQEISIIKTHLGL
jgi:hypothetical protein